MLIQAIAMLWMSQAMNATTIAHPRALRSCRTRGHDAAPALRRLAPNAAAGWWWADPLAALVIVFYAMREAREIFLGGH